MAAVAAVWGGANVAPAVRPAIVAAAIVALLAMAYGTHRRNQVWRTEESLWLDVTQKSPANGRGLMTYGVIQMGKGNYAAAEQYFDRALKYTPKYAYLHVNIGVLKGALGQSADAERHFREAQQYDPRNPVSYFYYARWLDSVGRRDEALGQLREAIALSPGHVDAQNLLHEIQTRPAAPAVKAADPQTAEQWLALSLAHYQAGRYQDCVDSSLRALKLRPDYAEAFNNLCAADNALGRYQDAIDACDRAIALKPDFTLARNNLAVAKAKLRR
jgi:tetratricopeptide (TPR) repeat protein